MDLILPITGTTDLSADRHAVRQTGLQTGSDKTGAQPARIWQRYAPEIKELEYDTMFFSKKSASQQAFSRETNELKRQIELSKTAILSAQNQFEQVVDPTLVDCYIYELNAAQLRYQFLLRRLKKRELQEV